MKSSLIKLFAVMAAAATLTLGSCQDDFYNGINGVGEITESNLYPDSFEGIVNSISADIYITQGDQQKVAVEAQANIIDNIELDVIDGKWHISYDRPVMMAKPVRIYITLPLLTSAMISGSGSVFGETPLTGIDKLNLTISGSGSMNLDVEANEIRLLTNGSGNFDLSGTAGAFKATISGSGNIKSYSLEVSEADITISGSGSAFISAEELLEVNISGSGSVYYTGTPEISANISGSGKIRHQ